MDLTMLCRPEAATMIVAVSSALAACDWANIDAIAPLPVSGDGIADVTLPVTGEEIGEASPPADESLDSANSSEVERDAFSTTSLPCTSNAVAVEQWTFDATAQGWTLLLDTDVAATLTWTGTTGNPAAGALEVDTNPAPSDAAVLRGAWLVLDQTPPSDLSDRTLSAWVWLDSGPSPHLKAFAQTGTQWAWADGGTFLLTPHAWTCVSLSASAPAYNQANYDPTDVIRIGFEMLGPAAFRVYVDSVRYD
jgi:hypothetical protein